MDTYAAAAQNRLQNAANGAAVSSSSQNTNTGSTDFMDMIASQMAAQRATANEQQAQADAARTQAMRDQNAQAQSERAQNRQEQNDRAQDAQSAQEARRQNTKDNAPATRDKNKTSSSSSHTSPTRKNQPSQQTQSTAKNTTDSDTDPSTDAQVTQDAADAAAADTAQKTVPAQDDSTMPADLQKLLEEIAAQLQTTKQNSPFATEAAEATSSQATSRESAGSAQNAQTLALLTPAGKQTLLQALQSLMNGLPASSRPTIETLEKGVLKPLDNNNLTASAANADTTADGTTALIVSGLTPQQLTDLMKKLKDGDDKDGTLSAGNFMINLVQIQPAALKKDAALFQPRGSILPAQTQPQTPAQLAADLASKGFTDGKGDIKGAENSQLTGLTAKGTGDGISGIPPAPNGFDHILRMFESARASDSGNIANTDKSTAKTPDVTAGNSALSATSQTVAGDITSGFSLDSIYPEGLSMSGIPATGTTVSYSLNSATPATSLITAAPQAIYAHPATQEVAATLVKQAGEGDSTALTLRLDPPELGKIAVKMEFSTKDKTVKAVISADKPETYLLLQRDAHVLQRSLHDAGLNTGQNGLTFELSQDGSAFNQQNQGQQQGSGGQSSGGDSKSLTIETKMDWSVDTSGTWHYNALA